LIVIIALGESIVAVGAGMAGQELVPTLIVAAVLGVVIAAGLWWAYFDVVAIVAARHFREARGHRRLLIARDSYSYLHLPMVAGIVFVALGIKKGLGHVDEPLKLVPAAALFGGLALYYAGHIGFRLRNVGTLNRQRLVVVVLCVALVPLVTELDALVSLALAAAVTSGLIAYEAIRFGEARARMRAAAS
jgi:low temperature requirement protein LtrA